MRKVYVIDGRSTDLYVLIEERNRIVYIPTRALMPVDFQNLDELVLRTGNGNIPLLEVMADAKLPSNGMNALIQYDKLIQVAEVHENGTYSRLRKPTDPRQRDAVKDSSASGEDLLRILVDFMEKSDSNMRANIEAMRDLVKSSQQQPAVSEKQETPAKPERKHWRQIRREEEEARLREEEKLESPSDLVSPSA